MSHKQYNNSDLYNKKAKIQVKTIFNPKHKYRFFFITCMVISTLILIIAFANQILNNANQTHVNKTSIPFSSLNKETSTPEVTLLKSKPSTFYIDGIDYSKNTIVGFTITVPDSYVNKRISIFCTNLTTNECAYSFTTKAASTINQNFMTKDSGKYQYSVYYKDKNITDLVKIDFTEQTSIDITSSHSNLYGIIPLDGSN